MDTEEHNMDMEKDNKEDMETAGQVNKHTNQHHKHLHSNLHQHFKAFTWSWFISPLAAFGLSLVLANLPFRFHGLTALGKIIYIFGLAQYTLLIIFVSIRMITKRGVFRLPGRAVAHLFAR